MRRILREHIDCEILRDLSLEQAVRGRNKERVTSLFFRRLFNRGNESSTYLSNSIGKFKVFSKDGYRDFNVPTNNHQEVICNVFNMENGGIKPVNTYN